jgi:alanine racemase
MVVLKADAYGHGLASVGRFLAPLAEEFAVANVAEAVALSESVDPRRISILGPALPGERAEISARGFVPVVSDWEEAVAYAALGRGREPVCVHFAVDTGMGRIGVWHEEALELGRAVAECQLTDVPVAGGCR